MTNEYQTKEKTIMNLQRYLLQLSYFDPSIPAPIPSGKWDPNTEKALIAFQKMNNLPTTGRADAVTWELLFAAYLSSIEQKKAPLPFPLFPRLPENHEVDIGEESFTVRAIQYMLDEITLMYENLGNFPIDGIFGQETATAVTEFQNRNLLPPTGKVGRETWNALVEAYRLIFEDYEQ